MMDENMSHNQENKQQLVTTFCSKPTPLFLQKLYDMIDSASSDTFERNIIRWCDIDETIFIVFDLKAFEEKVLPKRFTSMGSFRRQLSYYGFKKITRGPLFRQLDGRSSAFRQDDGLFQRGRPDLLAHVKRTSRNTDSGSEQQELVRKIDGLSVELDDLRNELLMIKDDIYNEMKEIRGELNSKRKRCNSDDVKIDYSNLAIRSKSISQMSNQQPMPLNFHRNTSMGDVSWSSTQAELLAIALSNDVALSSDKTEHK